MRQSEPHRQSNQRVGVARAISGGPATPGDGDEASDRGRSTMSKPYDDEPHGDEAHEDQAYDAEAYDAEAHDEGAHHDEAYDAEAHDDEAHDDEAHGVGGVSIVLSPSQVEHVVRAAGQRSGGIVSSLLLLALDYAHDPPLGSDPSAYELQRASQVALHSALADSQLSQSLLRGLSVLACYGPERPWRAISELAELLDMSPSTTHRYVKTLKAVGLLEQDPTTRDYRPVSLEG
jgi:IclR helix-turn-helix domain